MKPKNLRELKPEFIRLYTEEEKSIREIARIYNIDKSSVSRYIYEDIKPRKRGLSDTQKNTGKKLYEQGYSINQIAKKINGSPSTIKSFLIKEYGEITISNNKKYEHLRESFIKDYTNGLSSREISKKYNVSPSTILNYIGEKGVMSRNYIDSSKRYDINHDYFNILSPKKAYILGLIIGSSSINKKSSMEFIDVRIQESKRDFLEKIASEIYTKETPVYNTSNNTLILRIFSKKMSERIKSLGLYTCCNQECNISKDLEMYKKEILKGILDVSTIVIDKGVCIKLFNNQKELIISLLREFLELEASSLTTQDIFSKNENLKKIKLTFCKEYAMYIVKDVINYDDTEYIFSNIKESFKIGEYVSLFLRDQEFNKIRLC